MNKIKKSSIKKVVIIIGILIIPLMYSYFYLNAFWDPYSKLENLPVAVVNEDEGAAINGNQRNLGNELKNKVNENKQLNFIFTDKSTAYDGLINHKYYATITIPKEFTKDISTASETNKVPATIVYSPNEETNYLATQILNKAIGELTNEVKANVTGEIVNQLTDNLNQVPSKLEEINSGVNKLYNGSNDLANGTYSLMEGTNSLNKNYSTFNDGIYSLKSGISTLYEGNKKINLGINSALAGSKKLNDSTKNLYQINDNVKLLNKGASDLSSGTSQYVAGVNQLISQSSDIAQNIKTYITNNPTCLADSNMLYIYNLLSDASTSQQMTLLASSGNLLKTSSATLSGGLNLLSQNTVALSQIHTGIDTLTSGLETLSAGSNDAVAGCQKLNNGASDIASASNKISSGISSINAGTVKVNNGTVQLKDGLNTANSGISDGIVDTNKKLESTVGLSNFVKDPVKVEQKSVNSVPNYGTAFSAYFMSLSLWVGGLIIFVGIYLDADDKFKILSRKSDKKVLRTFIYLLIGIFQALLLALVIQKCLHLTILNVGMYYFACVLVAVVFISIIQFFMVNFKDAGKFIVILLLILQLTSCGGTFPMELVPGFFNKLYKFMPMTYSVNLFKEAISGGNMTYMMNNIYVLLSILFVFVTITIIAAKIKLRNNSNQVEA